MNPSTTQYEDNRLILKNDQALLEASMEDSDLAVVANTLDSLFQKANHGKYPNDQANQLIDQVKNRQSKESAGFSDSDELRLGTL